ncbi:MAG: beta-propeller fold lactonase family protein [Bacteroidota bacterium]
MNEVYPLSICISKIWLLVSIWLFVDIVPAWSFQKEDSLVKIQTIEGNIGPRSIHNSSLGEFLISNPRHDHSLSIFNNKFEEISFFDNSLLNQIPQKEDDFGKLIPITACFSHFGKYAWVSTYPSLSTTSLIPTEGNCESAYKSPPGYIFKLNTQNARVEATITTGKYPVNLIATPDYRFIIAANSCSKDLHIIDANTHKLIQVIPLGKYPLGLSTDSQSRYLFATLTESSQMAIIDLKNFEVKQVSLGKNENPMFVQVSPNGKFVYVSLAGSGALGKYIFDQDTLILDKKISSGRSPRSLELTPDGSYLYVANYLSHTVGKVRTADMQIIDTVHTPFNPVDLSFDPESSQLWVASNQQRNISVYLDLGQRSSQPYKRTEESSSTLSPSLQAVASRSVVLETQRSTSTMYQARNSQDIPRDTLIHLILGSFSERANAEKFLGKLSSRGIVAFLLPKEEGVIRIGMGTFHSVKDARTAASQLKDEEGISSWLKIR